MTGTNDKEHFLYPRGSYRGEFEPKNLLFNANLQEFAQRVSYICNLETNGKITSLDAYTQIKNLWQKLKHSKQALGIGEPSFGDSDDDE